MMNSLTYLNRGCPRKCQYCTLRDAKGVGKELTPEQWIRAFEILHELGVDFNLILGNETWSLGEDLLTILTDNKITYAIYTTCPEPLFSRYRERFFDSGVIDNLSCGLDYPPLSIEHPLQDDDSYKKSMDAWKGLLWLKENYPDMDSQGNITAHKHNLKYIPALIDELSAHNIFSGVNFIHWNKDGGFDFFPAREVIKGMLFTEKDLPEIRRIISIVLEKPGLLQIPEILTIDPEILISMGWHCQGDPYGGPTIDADGTLRVCGYRKGTRTCKLTIFDLPKRLDDWKEAVYLDAMDCAGCHWTYPWMFKHWNTTDEEMGKIVFSKHAGTHIPKDKWSKRKIQ